MPIKVLAPNGGESWEAGTPHIIRWEKGYFSWTSTKLEYSTDRGNHFKYINMMSCKDTYYSWMVPNTPSTGCIVRVSETSLSEDFSDGLFTITANPTLTIDVPGGGENWTVGSVHYIVWHGHLFSGAVDFEFSIDGGLHFRKLVDQITNPGSYPWTVPDTPSDNCIVRLRGSSSGSPSADSSPFTISAPVTPTITVTSPKSGDEWQAGTQQNIMWTCSQFSDPVSILYSTNGGGSYTTIENTTQNDGMHPWLVPDVSSTQCKIRVADASDSDPSGYSDGFFTILSTETPEYSLIVTHTGDSAVGSLRYAIDYANNHPGPDTILFHIPYTDDGFDEESGVWTISPLSALPDITGPDLLIDGYSQYEFIGVDTNAVGPEIAIDGTEAGEESNGFTILSHGVGIKGLIINHFPGMGILYHGVEGGRVSGCYIGTDYTGCTAVPNRAGIVIEGCYDVTIVPSDTLPNVISGNTESGIVIQDHSTKNIIGGNLIGLDPLISSIIGNGNNGIAVTEECDSNVVMDNRIGGNGIGILILNSNYNTIMNNLIGTEPTWTLDLGNQNGGIVIQNDATDNKVIENTIGYNGEFGVQVQDSGSIRNRISRNLISKNLNAGILIEDGANEDIPAPEIGSFFELEIEGTGVPGQILEFFSDEGNQGQSYLGSTTIDDTTGYFKYPLAEPPPFSHITVTAIDAAGNTSPFSNYFTTTYVDEPLKARIPRQMALYQNYPNPFNPVTTIKYSLRGTTQVQIVIYDLLGKKVTTLVNDRLDAGIHTVQWNTSNLAAGIYICKLITKNFIQERKMLLLK